MTSVYLIVTNPTRRFHHHDVITSTNTLSPHTINLGFGFQLNHFKDTGTFRQLLGKAWENSVAYSYFAHELKVNFVPKLGIICKVASVHKQTDDSHHWFAVDKRETPYGSCTQSLDHVCVILCLLMTEKGEIAAEVVRASLLDQTSLLGAGYADTRQRELSFIANPKTTPFIH